MATLMTTPNCFTLVWSFSYLWSLLLHDLFILYCALWFYQISRIVIFHDASVPIDSNGDIHLHQQRRFTRVCPTCPTSIVQCPVWCILSISIQLWCWIVQFVLILSTCHVRDINGIISMYTVKGLMMMGTDSLFSITVECEHLFDWEKEDMSSEGKPQWFNGGLRRWVHWSAAICFGWIMELLTE